eukprot:UN06914
MNGKEKAKLYTQNNPLISDTETKENGINIFNGNEKLTLTLYADVSCRDFLIRRSNILDDISEDTGCTITTNRTDESSRSFEIILTGKYENVQKARLKIDEFSSEMKRRTTCVYIDNESYKSMKDQWKIFQSLASNNYNTTVILAKDDQKTGVYVYCVGDLNNRLRALAALDVQIHRDTTVRNQSNALSMQRRREKIRSMKFEDHGIGGLETELKTMVRRAFNSRTISEQLRRELGMQHTKGVLFYGPPGTGKSLIARKLSELLGCNDPKIVNSPEVESKWVGEAEKNIRGLFEDAIKDYEQNGDNAQLHVVIFDELDSIAKRRGGAHAKSRDGALNQMLCSLDGINEVHNLLVFGLTNRMDTLDPALLRPGRLEVQIEIGLPDLKGREEILNIHTTIMRKNNRMDTDVDLHALALYSDGFSGADLSGFVRNAQSFALDDLEDEDKCFVNQKHLEKSTRRVSRQQT